MSFKLSKLANAVDEVDVSFAGESCTVKFRPNVMTPAWEKQLRKSMKAIDGTSEEDQSEAATQMFFDTFIGVVVSWDVLDDDDVPLPITVAALEPLPYAFLSKVVQACLNKESISPKG